MKSRKTHNDTTSLPGVIALTLVLGSLWGLTEALAGGAMRTFFPPLRAALCTGLGMGILGFGIGMNLPRRLLPAAAIVTAATMMLAVPLLQCSPLCRANAALAVMLHGTMLALSVPILANGRNSLSGFAAAGFCAALLSSAMFHTLGLRLAPCQYLLSFAGDWGLARFILKEGLPWAAFSAALLPLGVALGRRHADRIALARERTPRLFYGTTAASIIVILAIISASIKWG